MSEVYVIGAGIHPFGRHDGKSGLDLGVDATKLALNDCGLEWSDVEAAFGGSSASGNADALMPRMGLTGIQFINVANGCATGGSAVLSAYWAIKAGEFDTALAVGFDKHPRGSFNPDPEKYGLPQWYGDTGLMLTTQFFALKIQRYMHDHGISARTLARVASKAFENGSRTPHAWRRAAMDQGAILASRMISDPLTQYMFCSPSEGGVALILASEKKARALGRTQVRLRSAAMKTRPENSFEVFSPSLSVERGETPTMLAARAAFDKAGLGPKDIDVAQLQDTESGAEIMHMAENGFCRDGDQEQWLADGRTALGGQLPINTDGGCIACGEPIGASGLRQVYENVLQLRGNAENRQVENARLAYSQVYGAPGLAAVAILEKV
ncbi:acetyl-CoA acetyltransferase [Sphingopyxis bauzanensis]|jgi:acetyl-CoA acetyltransferase|uniref:Acetyl-CoA acetyltransferase n=1 Tax=Sphingopyxis bauzanensis TaxID=651663 RepID=A0A246JJE0_9SPHN|nr:thiolase family protein [Sphingopyxis bauzanensis]OHC99630.1 MAG: acetyl-CoA acetyltransferase [Sphingopyxis sp. RIFCSPHIGHO2_01_FULL_65_24]OWQ92702.1 acetyl-CoA acetyltransferase [Sphingopyxis bauzanensis]GGJ60823.1 acetyl-CoA acetyltransferase [Sphingopyxis bauzanensis]